MCSTCFTVIYTIYYIRLVIKQENAGRFYVAPEWFLSGDYAFHLMFTALIRIDLNTRGAGSYEQGAREATGYRCSVKKVM